MSVPPPYPLIEGFWIRNYKSLKQVAVGSSFQQSVMMDLESDIVPYELTPLTVFVGESGVGKSTVLDAFSFIADCLELGLDEAVQHRGGYDAIYTRGGQGPITFGVVFRYCLDPSPLTYVLNIDRLPNTNKAYVETEAILYREAEGGQHKPVLFFQNGEKSARHIRTWHNASGAAINQLKNTNQKTLALGLLAKYEDIPDIPQFKQYLSQYFVANFSTGNAAGLSPSQFKFAQAENLATDLKRVKEKHPTEFTGILDVIAKRIPGVERLEYKVLESGRAVLSVYHKGESTPIYPFQMSEGDLRLLSHLTLLEDPIPARLVGIEEPAAYIGRKHIMSFIEGLQHYIRELGGTQFFITTHSNTFIDQMDPTEVWLFCKDKNGNIQASRCLDELQFQGVDLNSIGPFWWTDYIYRNNTFGSKVLLYKN
ncbi:ATPase [Planctomycetales bacterium]|nr:ATPase [Planctomycetales bacterium]